MEPRKASRHRFQSAPLTGARGDYVAVAGLVRVRQVSIRSPHRSKGRLRCRCGSCPRPSGFNPLPSPEQGEISDPQISARFSRPFQSAPLTGARGDRFSTISPRITPTFQSAPLTGARGDECVSWSPAVTRYSFNPLPSPEQGEIPEVGYHGLSLLGFNPLPSPEQGEIYLFPGRAQDRSGFNPLPSPEQGEMAV